MSIDREESLFLTVSENHCPREYPEYVQIMSDPYREAGGMIAAYEGVVLGGGDKLYGLEELNLWLRRHRYAAYDMHVLLPITHICLEYVVRKKLADERPGVPVMAEQAARELLDYDPLRLRHSSRGWMSIYWLTEEFPRTANEESRRILKNFSGFEHVLQLFTQLVEESVNCADARALVEQAVGMTVPAYFAAKGESAFREREKEAVASAAASGGKVIATGGGAILRPENLRALRRTGRLVFLDRSPDKLTATADRPLSADPEALRRRYEERYDIYCAAADLRVNGDGSPEDTAERIEKEWTI